MTYVPIMDAMACILEKQKYVHAYVNRHLATMPRQMPAGVCGAGPVRHAELAIATRDKRRVPLP